MKIQNLKLNNFGIIKEAEFNFRPGVNLILGDNGMGKSHIIKALAFLLINYKEKTIEDYCNWNSEKFAVELNLDHLQKNFKFDYKYVRKSNTLMRELYIDNEYFKGQDATDELSKYFDSTLCRASIISFQGKVNLVNAKPAERRENLKKIYNLDFSKQVKELDGEIKSIEDEQLKQLNDSILILKNKDYTFTKPQKLPNSKADYDNHQIELLKLQNKIVLIEKEIKEYNEKLTLQQSIQTNIDRSKNEFTSCEQKICNLEKDILTNEELLRSDFEDKLRELNKELLQDFEIEKGKIEEEIISIKLTRVPSFDETRLEELINAREGLLDVWKEDKRQYELCKQGKCPTCGNLFTIGDTGFHKTNMDKNKIILDKQIILIDELKTKKQEIEKQKNDMLALKNKKEILNLKLESEIKDIQNRKDKILKNIETEKIEIEHKKTIHQNNINQFNTQIIQIKEIKDKEQIRLTELQESLQNLYIPDEIPSIQKEDRDNITVLKIAIDNYNTIIERNEFITKQNKQIKEEKEKDKVTLKIDREKRDEIIIEIEQLKKGKIILQKEFPNFVISTMVGDIEDGINELTTKVYNGKYEVVVKENKGGMDILYGERQASIEIASGFEKGLFNFGYKHAFSQIAGLGILLLDEIDAFASEKNSEKLFNVIGQLKNLYQQIFIITHKPFVQEILQRDYQANTFEIKDGKVQNY